MTQTFKVASTKKQQILNNSCYSPQSHPKHTKTRIFYLIYQEEFAQWSQNLKHGIKDSKNKKKTSARKTVSILFNR